MSCWLQRSRCFELVLCNTVPGPYSITSQSLLWGCLEVVTLKWELRVRVHIKTCRESNSHSLMSCNLKQNYTFGLRATGQMLHLPLDMGLLVSGRWDHVDMTHTDQIGESLCCTVALCLINYIWDAWKLAVYTHCCTYSRYIFKTVWSTLAVKRLEQLSFFNVKRSLLCSPGMQLFDQINK